jgi:hypothetical protein
MDSQVDSQIHGHRGKHTDKPIERSRDRQTDEGGTVRYTNEGVDRWMKRQKDRLADGLMEGRKNGGTDRWIDRERWRNK